MQCLSRYSPGACAGQACHSQLGCLYEQQQPLERQGSFKADSSQTCFKLVLFSVLYTFQTGNSSSLFFDDSYHPPVTTLVSADLPNIHKSMITWAVRALVVSMSTLTLVYQM
jgi:hypothetical protein